MMKYLIQLIVISSWISLLFASCNSSNVDSDLSNANYQGDSFIVLEYAKAWKVNKNKNGLRLEIIEPHNQKTIHSYEIKKEQNNDFTVPLSKIIPMSATHVGMLVALQEINAIIGLPNKNNVHNDQLLAKIKSGDILLTSEFGTANLESFIELKPQAILYSGFDENNSILKKLKKANIPTIANYEWKENHPLGRAEWIKFFGILLHKEKEADSIFNHVKRNYETIKDSINKYSKNKPTVFVGTPYGDQFNVPAGESYMAKILEDLNVDYIYKHTKGVGSKNYSLEKIINENKTTDFWLNVAAVDKKNLLNLNRKFNLLQCIDKGNVYTYFHNVNKFWEESALRPDIILRDLAILFHPELFEQEKMVYYQKVKD